MAVGVGRPGKLVDGHVGSGDDQGGHSAFGDASRCALSAERVGVDGVVRHLNLCDAIEAVDALAILVDVPGNQMRVTGLVGDVHGIDRSPGGRFLPRGAIEDTAAHAVAEGFVQGLVVEPVHGDRSKGAVFKLHMAEREQSVGCTVADALVDVEAG